MELLSTKRRLKRIAPLQLGKALALVCGILGLIFIIPIFLIMALASSPVMLGPMALGMGFTLFIPIIYAAVGFVFGVLAAAIYNIVAKWVGGIVIEVEWDRDQG